jgi:hypothetical protein
MRNNPRSVWLRGRWTKQRKRFLLLSGRDQSVLRLSDLVACWILQSPQREMGIARSSGDVCQAVQDGMSDGI